MKRMYEEDNDMLANCSNSNSDPSLQDQERSEVVTEKRSLVDPQQKLLKVGQVANTGKEDPVELGIKKIRVVNLSREDFPPAHIKLLEKGLDFNLKDINQDLRELICHIEAALQQRYTSQGNDLQKKIKIQVQCENLLGKNFEKAAKEQDSDWATIEEIKSKKFRCLEVEDENLVIIFDGKSETDEAKKNYLRARYYITAKSFTNDFQKFKFNQLESVSSLFGSFQKRNFALAKFRIKVTENFPDIVNSFNILRKAWEKADPGGSERKEILDYERFFGKTIPGETKYCNKRFIVFQKGNEELTIQNPVFPYILNLYVNFIKDELKKKFENENNIFPVWITHVDEILVVSDQIQYNFDDLLQYINIFEDLHIKFEKEEEIRSEGKLAFSDFFITKQDQSITIDVNPERTNSVYIPYDYNYELPIKLRTFENDMKRLQSLLPIPESYQKELERLKDIARLHGYEPEVIDELIENDYGGKLIKNSLVENIRDSKNEMVLPYNDQLCAGLDEILKNHGFEVKYEYLNTIHILLSTTEGATDNLTLPGIYKINCGNRDCKTFYIGQTGISIFERYKQHYNDYKRMKDQKDEECQKSKKQGKSTLVHHCVDKGHDFPEHPFHVLSLVKEISGDDKETLRRAWEKLIFVLNEDNEYMVNRNKSSKYKSILLSLAKETTEGKYRY